MASGCLKSRGGECRFPASMVFATIMDMKEISKIDMGATGLLASLKTAGRGYEQSSARRTVFWGLMFPVGRAVQDPVRRSYTDCGLAYSLTVLTQLP